MGGRRGIWSTVVVAGALTVFALAAASPCLDLAYRYDTAWWGMSPADTTLLQVAATEYTSATEKDRLRDALRRAVRAAGEGTTMVHDLAGDGAPAIGVYRREPDPLPGLTVTGRWFTPQEMAGTDPVVLLRRGSYLARRAADSPDPWPGPMPIGEVVGTFDAPGRDMEYVVPLFALGQVEGDYYLRSRDPDLVDRVTDPMTEAGYVIRVGTSPTRLQFVTGGPLTAPLAGLLVVGLVTLALVVAVDASTRRDRAAVHALLGADRPALARGLALRWGTATALGVGIGSLSALAVIAVVDPNLAGTAAHPVVLAGWLLAACVTSVITALAATLPGLKIDRR